MRARPGARALPVVPALAVAVLALTLTACGGEDTEAAPDATASVELTDDPTADAGSSDAPSEEATDDAGASSAGNDICALLTDDEVAGVIGAAQVAADYVIGERSAPDGGQCVWSTDPSAITTGAASNLELVVYRGSLALPPDDAPEPGSSDVATLGNATYFADAEAVYAIRVTGEGATDDARVKAAAALVTAVRGRL